MKLLITVLICGIISSVAQANIENDNAMLINELLNRADSIFNSREYEKSREIYLQTAETAENSKDNSALTEAWSMIARTYLILDKKEVGRKWIYKARNIANIEEPTGWSRYLGVRGRFEWQDKELDKAAKTFEEMYQFCSEQKLHERAIDAAHMMAIVSDLEGQVIWAKKGIAEAEAGEVTRWLGPLWNNLGATYEDLGKYKNAIEAYLKAREYHYEYGSETNKMIADWAVGHAYRLNGDFQNAEKWIRPVLDWSVKLNNIEFIGWANHELGEIELARENSKSALEHLIKAAEYLKEAEMPSWDPDGFQKQIDKIKEIEKKLSAAKRN